MAKQDPLDKAIREKMQNFEATPREKVWDNIRGEIQTGRKFGGYDWLGVSLLLIAGTFFVIHFTSRPTLPHLLSNEAETVTKTDQGIAQNSPKITLSEEDLKETETMEENNIPVTEDETPEVKTTESRAIAAAPVKNTAPKNTTGAFPKAQTEEKQKETVKKDLSEPVEITPKKIIPDPEILKDVVAPTIEEVKPVRSGVANEEEEDAAKLEQGENVVKDGIQTQRSKILGIVTDQAEKTFGIKADYEEKEYEDYKKTKFSADFNFLKIKRVKTKPKK